MSTMTRTLPRSTAGAAAGALVLRRVGRTLAANLASVLILCVAWQATLKALAPNPYVAKTPDQVLRYLLGAESTATMPGDEIRSHLARLLLVTLGDASIGFVFGAGASCLIALLFWLAKPLEVMFLPIAMGLCTVPLLAIAPVIALLFGNGLVTDIFICGVVVFFPILVNLTIGLRSAGPLSVDLIRVYGGSRLTVLRKVALPTALPYLLASLRVAAPASVGGAMLYEWLFTFKGLGAGIVAAKHVGDYNQLWAIAVVVTVAAVALYGLMSVFESLALAAFGPEAGRSGNR